MNYLVRGFLFVILTTSIVGSYCWLTGRVLPPLRDEPLSFLLLPMTVISAALASLVYPVLHRQRSRSARIPYLYFAFLISLILYGLYLWHVIPDGTAGMIVLSLLAGHLYGLPPFLTVLLASSVMDHLLFGRSTLPR